LRDGERSTVSRSDLALLGDLRVRQTNSSGSGAVASLA
jgi:hypothetical protein